MSARWVGGHGRCGAGVFSPGNCLLYSFPSLRYYACLCGHEELVLYLLANGERRGWDCVCVRVVCICRHPQVLPSNQSYTHPIIKPCRFYLRNLFCALSTSPSLLPLPSPTTTSLPGPKASLLWSPGCRFCPTYSLFSIMQPGGSPKSDRLKVLQRLPVAFSIKLECLASLCASK